MNPLLAEILSLLVFFGEPGFPMLGIDRLLPAPEGALVAQSVEETRAALKPGKVLVWRHGSTFPAELWGDLIGFLEQGGSMLVLGTDPFTRVVTGSPGERKVGSPTVNLLKELRLNQSYTVDVEGGETRWDLSARSSGLRSPPLPASRFDSPTQLSILEPRLSDTRDFSHEDGAPGSRDARITSLCSVLFERGTLHDESTQPPRFPDACAVLAIDRLRGRFAGGRWLFRPLSRAPGGSAESGECEVLYRLASAKVMDLRVDPILGCFHSGECPAVRVSIHDVQSGLVMSALDVDSPSTRRVAVSCRCSDGTREWSKQVSLPLSEHASTIVRFPEATRPGLYRVSAELDGPGQQREQFETGFWVFDAELFASGDELSFDSYTLTRNGRPEPVIGTTVMSAEVHRKFLFEPNAAVWDDTFAELASLDINLVRTGVWSAYRKISLDPNVIDEAWLRALEAYYLCARRHGIPVIFTFFSFVPEPFGGVNPYFDPRSLEAQRAYIRSVVQRFSNTREMLWDLINEPSFSSPDKLWMCRPSADRYEHAAFLAWLQQRYGAGWQGEVRDRWRLRPNESIGLPTDDDFVDRHHIGDHRPYRAKEYIHFAQDAFATWATQMSQVIRQAGSNAAITVGQDEGGLNDRPHPLFHADPVDFTSIHSWWYNDGLLWDSVQAKAPGKPLLVSESGIMQRELLSGESIRTPKSAAALLSRKVGHAFAGAAFGLVEWCYDVNPFMASDNEVAIGLIRADGSYKPEHKILREFAAFIERHGHEFQGLQEPRGVLLFPSADHYSPRGLQLQGTRRVLEIFWQLGWPLQLIPEYRASWIDRLNPEFVVLPSTRGLSDEACAALDRYLRNGGKVICSGAFERDDAGRPRERLGVEARRLAHVEPCDLDSHLRFPLEIQESAFAAVSTSLQPSVRDWHSGKLLHFALPIDWGVPSEVQPRLYRKALQQLQIAPAITSWEVVPAGVVVRGLRFDAGECIVAVNENSQVRELRLQGGAVKLPAALTTLVWIDGEGHIVEICSPTP